MDDGMKALLTPEFQGRLTGLELALRRALPSTLRGDRRSPTRKGISLEFADYRAYVPGDDVRHLDWATYGRLDQLIVKLYHDEEDVQLHLLIDDSRSMSGEKLFLARQIAAGLAWIGLANANRVSLVHLADDPDVAPLTRGTASFGRLLDRLAQPSGAGTEPLHRSCQAFARRSRPRGVVILVSDLMDPAGVAASLRELQTPTAELDVIHVLDAEELEPSLEGDLRLIDSETGQKVEVSLAPSVLEAYRRTARAFVADCAETCRRRGAAYAQTSTKEPFESFLLRILVQQGILR